MSTGKPIQETTKISKVLTVEDASLQAKLENTIKIDMLEKLEKNETNLVNSTFSEKHLFGRHKPVIAQ